MNLAGGSRDFLDRQIDFVRGAGGRATGGGELIRNRTDGRTLDGHFRLQLLRRIMLRGLVHDLSPHRQRQSGTVASRHDRSRLIESNPHTAGQRAGEPDEPGVLIIVRCSSLPRCR